MDNFRANRRTLYKYNRKLGMNISNAAIAAGFPRSLVEKHKSSLPVPLTQSNATDFPALFEQKQMTDVKKVEHAIAGMNSMRVIVDKLGREHLVPDWNARHKYFETMLKLCKQLEKSDSSTTNNVLVMNGDFAEQLRKSRERATEERKAELVKEKDDDVIDVPAAPETPAESFNRIMEGSIS